MRRAFGPHHEEDDTDIDLTPMLDVVFIMLIFFIVTASFIKEYGIGVNSPTDNNTPPPDKKDEPILVRIEKTGRIWVRDTSVDIAAVRNNIERLHAESPNSNVIIQADDEAKTDWLIRVMNQSRQAGVYNVSIAETE